MNNIKSFIPLFSATLAVVTSAFFIPLSAHANDTIDDGVIRIGTDLTYPPYNYFDDNNAPAGFDVDLMKAISKETGSIAEFVDTRFENLILGLNSGQFDVIASTLYVKPERAKKIDYVAYMKTGVSIAVSKSSNYSFTKPEELCGYTVGSIKGAAWLAEIQKLNTTQCVNNPIDSREFPTSPEVTQALLSGGIDAQIEDSAVLANASKKLNGRITISSSENFYPVIVGLGIKKGNDELSEKITQALKQLEKNGVYNQILKEYNVSKPTDKEFLKAIGK